MTNCRELSALNEIIHLTSTVHTVIWNIFMSKDRILIKRYINMNFIDYSCQEHINGKSFNVYKKYMQGETGWFKMCYESLYVLSLPPLSSLFSYHLVVFLSCTIYMYYIKKRDKLALTQNTKREEAVLTLRQQTPVFSQDMNSLRCNYYRPLYIHLKDHSLFEKCVAHDNLMSC